RGLNLYFSVTSAGTVAYQSGSPPDFRAVEALHPLGIDISALRARGMDEIDLYSYDWIFVMDDENYEDVKSLFPDTQQPRVHRVMEFVQERYHEEIQDPYYGSEEDFRRVSQDLFLASEMILNTLINHYPFLEE
ncbi:MAG: low molecular weight phosphotyrosine protein phosphatase, partial [Chlorobiaceae bacterium]|nr:low molecular weight phosphotyrosine protein phosphatase [Chlorobiaceae bacterium]